MSLSRKYDEYVSYNSKGLLFRSDLPRSYCLCWWSEALDSYLLLVSIKRTESEAVFYKWSNRLEDAHCYSDLKDLGEDAELLPKKLKLVVYARVEEFAGLVRNDKGGVFVHDGYESLVNENLMRIEAIKSSKRK